MGGQNHQPCNRYLVESTELSRQLSIGRVELEEANICIESILLDELREDSLDEAQMPMVLAHLGRSENALSNMSDLLDRIEQKLSENGGWEPPAVHEVDWDAVGRELEVEGAIDELAWKTMTQERMSLGFPGVIRRFRYEITNLRKLTGKLTSAIEGLEDAVRNRLFESAIEENSAGDFKMNFARLYSSWAKFQQLFLASALLSTESWYAWTKCGSMTQGGSANRRVA